MKGKVDADTKCERQGMSITTLSLQSFIHTQDKKIKNKKCVWLYFCVCAYVCIRDRERQKEAYMRCYGP